MITPFNKIYPFKSAPRRIAANTHRFWTRVGVSWVCGLRVVSFMRWGTRLLRAVGLCPSWAPGILARFSAAACGVPVGWGALWNIKTKFRTACQERGADATC